MDQRTKKLVSMHKFLHPKDDIYRLHVSGKNEEVNLPALKSVEKNQYKDNIFKKRKINYNNQ